jgi:AraC-like DNA-binding protein
VRFEFAKSALEAGDCSAAEISLQLGFSEPSAFFRTFKRWSGKTPGKYRQEWKKEILSNPSQKKTICYS